jgi:hypothetical protein
VTTFNNWGEQHGTINQVGHDQHISGGQQTTAVTIDHARAAVVSLRHAVASAPLTAADAAAGTAEVAHIDADIRQQVPDRGKVAGALERLVLLLSRAGALVRAGATLLQPLRTLALWLGDLGSHVLLQLNVI